MLRRVPYCYCYGYADGAAASPSPLSTHQRYESSIPLFSPLHASPFFSLPPFRYGYGKGYGLSCGRCWRKLAGPAVPVVSRLFLFLSSSLRSPSPVTHFFFNIVHYLARNMPALYDTVTSRAALDHNMLTCWISCSSMVVSTDKLANSYKM